MSTRTFSLVNGIGETFNLTTHDTFLYAPEGLGFEEDTTYMRYGERFRPLVEEFAQGIPAGILFFNNPDAYTKFRTFAAFTQKLPLTLLYRVDGTTYKRRVRVQRLTKTELEPGQELRCDVEFAALSPFYREISVISPDAGSSSGKTYDYTYDYTYQDFIPGTVVIDYDGDMPGPVQIKISATGLSNPRWSHYVEDELVATGKVNGSILSGNYLLVDDFEIPYKIQQVASSTQTVVRDMYEASDFSTERFIYLQPGMNRISAGHDGIQNVKLTVRGFIYYAAV